MLFPLIIFISFFFNTEGLFSSMPLLVGEKNHPFTFPNACFSPKEHCDETFISFLKTAQLSIDMAIFDITHAFIADTIIEKAKKIPIRILLDKRQAKHPTSQIKKLLESNAQVRYGKQRGLMHHKFTIIDKITLETGSFNYTNRGSHANLENQLYLQDPSVIKKFNEEFEKIWSMGLPYPIKKNNPAPLVTPASL